MTSCEFGNFTFGNLHKCVLQYSMVTVYSIVYMYIILADKMYATPSGVVYNRRLLPRNQVGSNSVHYHR